MMPTIYAAGVACRDAADSLLSYAGELMVKRQGRGEPTTPERDAYKLAGRLEKICAEITVYLAVYEQEA
jgi:hypothetical protein